jgi:hypothetical protein
MRARPIAVPAVAAVLEPVGVQVPERAAALPVQTAVVRELRAAVLEVASVAARPAEQVLVLVSVAALQAHPVEVRTFPMDREVASLVPGLDPPAGPVVIPLVALALALAVVQASPADPRAAPVVSVAALPTRAGARMEERVAAVALQRIRAAARAMEEAGVGLVADPVAADPVVVRGAARAVVGRRVDQPPAAPALALTTRAL